MWGRKNSFIFWTGHCCSRDMRNTIIYFFKKRLLLLKKHFETGMLLLPKIIFLLCDSTVHPVDIHIIRPNDRKTHARCKSGRSGQRGSGHKA